MSAFFPFKKRGFASVFPYRKKQGNTVVDGLKARPHGALFPRTGNSVGIAGIAGIACYIFRPERALLRKVPMQEEARELAADLDYLNGVVVLALDLEAVAALNNLEIETVRTSALIHAIKETQQ